MAGQIRAPLLGAGGDAGRPQRGGGPGGLLEYTTTTRGAAGRGAKDPAEQPDGLGRGTGGGGVRGALADRGVLQGDEERPGDERLPGAGFQGGRRVGAGVL